MSAATLPSDATTSISAALPNRRAALGEAFLLMLSIVLLGYAVGGRGFAYIGIPPLFVGEITLLVGVAAFVCCQSWAATLAQRTLWPLLAMCVWGGLQTLPYVSTYGLDSVRDAVVWGYSAYAIFVAALLIEEPARLTRFVARYRTFVPWFLGLIPIAFAVYHFIGENRVTWPWAAVPIVQVKEGDVLVHLSGVIAFWVSGLGGMPRWKYVALLTLNVAVMGVIDRAGMVAFGLVFGLCLLLKPMHAIGLRVVGTVFIAASLLWVTDLRVPISGGKGRDVSFDQIVTNVNSVLFDSGSDGLDSTKEWRLDWWKEIAAYTVHGKYFWTGKGYGINLADDDGFQVLADNSLRNPHSVHMTMLARGGVPGLTLWLLTQGVWGVAMLGCFLHSRRRGRQDWAGLFFFLTAYWAAFLVNGSFDVFIEGPPGGIWLWTIYGTGIGAIAIYRHNPDAFVPMNSGMPSVDSIAS